MLVNKQTKNPLFEKNLTLVKMIHTNQNEAIILWCINVVSSINEIYERQNHQHTKESCKDSTREV